MINIFKTVVFLLKTKKKGFIYRGGKVLLEKNSVVKGKGKLFFNCSQYKDSFNRKGHLWIGRNSQLLLNEGIVRFYSGCKVDVHNSAFLNIGGGHYI